MDRLKDEGRACFQSGDYVRAADAYTKALEFDINDHVLYSNRSACHLKLGQLDDALDDALRCTQLAPLWPKGYSRLGDALFAMKRDYSALRWFENGLRLDPTNKHMLEMVALLKKARPQPLEEDGESHPAPPESGKRPSFSLEPNSGRSSQSSPQYADGAHSIASLKEEGNRAFQAGDFLSAVECYTVALEADPKNAKLLSNRSACYCLLRRYKKALDDANRVVQLRPDWAKGYSRRGDALQAMLCLRMALSTYEMGLEFDPANRHMKDEVRKLQVELQAQDQKAKGKATAAPAPPTQPLAQMNGPRRPHGAKTASAAPSSTAARPVAVPVEPFTLRPTARTEVVTKHWYEWATKRWHETQITVQLEETPFQEGSMRLAFKMYDLSAQAGARAHVAKVFKPGLRCGQEQIWSDVEMYEICSSIASAFNKRKPPKTVSFCHCFLIVRAQTVPRHGRIMFVEPYLTGNFTKYNNNDGWCSMDDRNTPQAFSHFSYEHSQHEMLVVDIQGVGDVYTDPQIHTRTGQDFGPGNCGPEGIQRFFATHVCNPVCHFLRLPAYRPSLKAGGTRLRGVAAAAPGGPVLHRVPRG